MAFNSKDFNDLQKAKRQAHKFGAVRCRRGHAKFPSKLEREYYDYLLKAQEEGLVSFFLRQVPMHLPGGIKYVLDFLVFKTFPGAEIDWKAEFIDVKGKITDTYKIKKKLVEETYPIKIIEIKKGDF